METAKVKEQLESVGATAATGISIGSILAEANQWLQLGIASLTLLWWIRLWMTDKKDKRPPE